MIRKLTPEELRRAVDPATLEMETTEQLSPLEGIIGQKRAVSALQFGLGIHDRGFNIYVAGPPGIGKMTAVQAFIGQFARQQPRPPDCCYVHNFQEPYQPLILLLPPGRGRQLRDDMRQLIEDARREIPKAFESETYNARRDEIKAALNQQREAALLLLSQRATEMGFTLEPTPLGVAVIPVHKGQPLTEAQFQTLPTEEREGLQQRRAGLQQELDAMLKRARELERGAREKWQELDQQVALFVIGGLIDDLAEKYKDLPQAGKFINEVKRDILENIAPFKSAQAAQTGSEELPIASPWLRELPFNKYQVNVLVDASTQKTIEDAENPATGAPPDPACGAPVVVEINPSYNNLFGRIEKETHFGALYTDHTMIKAGSLHKASGGFLVLPVEELLRNPYSWDGLKRALQSREIEIEDLGDRLGLFTAKGLRPQPLPLHVKVVLIGRPLVYALLHANDEAFAELFKVKADFDTVMPQSDENVRDFAAFLGSLCGKENLRHLDRAAVALLLEHAARLAGDQDKLSTHFGAIADVVREADFWAKRADAPHIAPAHVSRALDEKVYRSNLIQERIQEMIARQTLRVDTTGAVVGQVNGLSVIELGDYPFGKPSRITASVAPGRDGIVDIEREVALSGPLHSKGVLILGGYLMQKFAQERPLTISARVVFEQSYEGVEGDSASSAELYALLSALSGVPLKQGIAVTGSVNQHGQLQAIGGVNEKIEGFFDVCRTIGLDGEQGVLIPSSNAQNLMLRRDLVEAAQQGKFHVWAVDTIDDGVAVLTGLPAGQWDVLTGWSENSVNARVDERLNEFAGSLREFGKAHDNNGQLHARHSAIVTARSVPQ